MPSPLTGRGEGLLDALMDAGAHPDLLAYVEKAREHGGTAMLSSLRTFHRGGEGDVGEFARLGTEKEQLLWREGAAGALDARGWDQTNEEILREIVDDVVYLVTVECDACERRVICAVEAPWRPVDRETPRPDAERCPGCGEPYPDDPAPCIVEVREAQVVPNPEVPPSERGDA